MIEGEPCGDAAARWVWTGAERAGEMLAIVDGLGHGVHAARAADTAIALIGQALLAAQPPSLPSLLRRLDDALADTRGVALGVAWIEGARMLYAAVGNTRAARWRGSQLSRLPSEYGIVGGRLARDVVPQALDIAEGDMVLMWTDGVDEMIDLTVRLPEWEREPALLCDHLLAQFARTRDDAGVLVWHWPEALAAPA